MKLLRFVVVVLIIAGNLGLVRPVAQKIRLPKIPSGQTIAGITYHGLIQYDTPSLPADSSAHSLTIRFWLGQGNNVVPVPLVLPRIVDEPEAVEEFEEDLFHALDGISRYRDPFFKTIRLSRWIHLAQLNDRQIASIIDETEAGSLEDYVFHRSRASYYRKIASQLEILRTTLMSHKEFVKQFDIDPTAGDREDDAFAQYVFHLNNRVVPRKAGGLWSLWENYRINQKIDKLPSAMREHIDYIRKIISHTDGATALEIVARRAFMRSLHSDMGRVVEHVPFVNVPASANLKDLLKYSDVEHQLWQRIYILQKSTGVSSF